jgi:hypothetical protein
MLFSHEHPSARHIEALPPMELVREFTVDAKPMMAHLAACTIPLEASQLYSKEKEEKFEDPSLRRSRFRLLADPTALDLAEAFVKKLNELDAVNEFSLGEGAQQRVPDTACAVRNNVTHIVYQAGDFFKAHQARRLAIAIPH